MKDSSPSASSAASLRRSDNTRPSETVPKPHATWNPHCPHRSVEPSLLLIRKQSMERHMSRHKRLHFHKWWVRAYIWCQKRGVQLRIRNDTRCKGKPRAKTSCHPRRCQGIPAVCAFHTFVIQYETRNGEQRRTFMRLPWYSITRMLPAS